MIKNLKLGGILLIITMISGLLLGFANDLTKEAIIENSKISKEDLSYIMPLAEKIQDTDIQLEEDDSIKEVYEAVSGNDVIGYVMKVRTKGFHGDVDFVVAISNEDIVTGMKVLSHSETPGLGAKITEEYFTERFRDKPATELLEVVKVTPNSDIEVEAISGATSSSKASVNAVNEAITFYLNKIKGQVVDLQEEATDVNTAASSN